MHPHLPGVPAAAAAAAVLLAAASPASATVVRALDVAQKSRIAQVIVVAKVERQEPRWMTEGGAVKTIVTLAVEQSLKGDLKAGQKIQVAVPGGRIGELVHEVPGVSTYTPGERAVLFLERHPDGWVELGIGIGKYEVKTAGGQAMVSHSPLVAQMKQGVGDQPAKLEPAPPMAPVTLAKFLAQIRAALAETP